MAEQSFESSLASGRQVALRWEDVGLQERAVSKIPLDALMDKTQKRLDKSLGALDDDDFSDVLTQELTRWFKREFFKWVDRPACAHCGFAETRGVAHPSLGTPTPEDRAHGAARVEVFHCPLCKRFTRFPRFNDPGKLLETRRGRCGEWANCFGLLLRSLGKEARWARDWTDHVWTEVYSDKLGRWVHCDPCEEAWDKPLLYSCGWGKHLSYVLAFGRHGVADVTARYVPRFREALEARKLVGEDWLERKVAALTAQIQSMMLEGADKAQWEAVYSAEQEELRALASSGQEAAENLGGRQSGSEAWRSERGELGLAAAGGDGDEAKKKKKKGREYKLRDFVLRVSGENPPDEMGFCLFDGETETKWLDFGFVETGSAFVEVEFAEARTLISYEMTSANDEPPRDPSAWILRGFPSGDGSEEVLHHVGETWRGFKARHMKYRFFLPSPKPCKRYRFEFVGVRDRSQANSIQLAQINLNF